MRLVADLDKISSNLNNLTTEIDSYNTNVSSFKSATINCTVEEVSQIIQSFKEAINNDLDKISNSSNEFTNLVTECHTEYLNNEQNINNIDVGTINTFIQNNPEVTYQYKENTRITTLPSNKIMEISSDKYINLSALKEGTNVYEAYQKYKDELENCKFCYVDGDHFIVINEIEINGVKTYQSHIVVNSGNQINGAPANGSYANGLEIGTSAANRLKSILLVNGSHFLDNGEEHLVVNNKIAIVNGEIKNGGTSGGQELLLDKYGNIYCASGKSAEELVNNGVKYSFSCHSTQVIENGDISPSYREDRTYNRTLIGQAGNCEYYVLTDLSGQKLPTSAEYLKNKGCNNAFSLDQGGSVSLNYKDKSVYYKGDDGEERPVGDFLYFT